MDEPLAIPSPGPHSLRPPAPDHPAEGAGEVNPMTEIEPGPAVAVAVIVEDFIGRVLLLKRAEGRSWPGHWCFPGGRVRKGESLKQACCREVMEEIGLQVWIDDLVRVGLTEVIDGDGHLVGLVYRARASSLRNWATNREPDKHSEIRWFRWYELPSPLMPGVAQWVLGRLRGRPGR